MRKKTKHKNTLELVTVAIIIIVGNITLANYSFLKFTPSGQEYNIILNKLLIQGRVGFVFIPLILLGISKYTLKQKIFRFWFKNWDILFWIWVMWFSLLIAPDVIKGWQYTFWMSNYLLILLIFFRSISYNSELESFKKTTLLLFKSHIVLLPLLIYGFLRFGGGNSRFTLGFGNHSFFSNPVLILSLLLISYLVIYKKSLPITRRNTLFALYLLLTLILFLTGRRTPLAVSVIAFGIMISEYYIQKQSTRYMLMLLLGGGGFFLVNLIPAVIEKYSDQSDTINRFNRVEINEDGSISEGSYDERLLIWGSYFKTFKKSPIIGGGFGNAQINNLKYGDNLSSNFSPHNLFVGTLVDTGIFGLIALVFIILRSARIMLFRKNKKLKISYFMIFFALLVLNFFEFNLYPGQALYLCTFVIILYPRCFIR